MPEVKNTFIPPKIVPGTSHWNPARVAEHKTLKTQYLTENVRQEISLNLNENIIKLLNGTERAQGENNG